MNTSFDFSTLVWAVPPLIGAVIGYVTNVIAIKMLFRPLREKRLFGLRLPLTPGIIPRQRHTLAESIGVMVSRDLITEDAVRGQLSSPGFGGTVRKKLHELMELIFYTPTGELPEKLKLPKMRPEDFPEYSSTAAERGGKTGTESLVTEILADFFRTEGFKNSIYKTVEYSVESICRLPMYRLIGEDGEKLLSMLSSDRIEKLREPVKLNIRLWLREQVRTNRHFSGVLTPQIIEGLVNVIDHLYPSLFQAFLDYLRIPKVHTQLEHRGKKVLRRILEKLSSFQRFFVLAGQYDRTLDERMDVVVDDVIDQLEKAGWDYETRKRFIDMIRRWLGGIADKNAGELMLAWRGDMMEDATKAVDSLFDWLASEKGLSVVRGMGESLFGRVSGEEAGTALYRLTGIETSFVSKTVAEWVVGMVATAGEGEDKSSSPAWNLIRSMAREISSGGSRSIAEILGVSAEDRDRLEGEGTRLFIRVLNEQAPLILESVDVRTLVVEKIDSLDIDKVEGLILQVIKSHLRWITLFGALLGFLIGALQLISFFML
ncbi:MAG: DUF445 domain-containing protein [Sediminispirochaetaceae bacterium]